MDYPRGNNGQNVRKEQVLIKRDFPKIHFYDQDFVDIYDKTWAWIQDCWSSGNDKVAMLHTALEEYATSDTLPVGEATHAATVPDLPVEITVDTKLSPPVMLADSPIALPAALSAPDSSTASEEAAPLEMSVMEPACQYAGTVSAKAAENTEGTPASPAEAARAEPEGALVNSGVPEQGAEPVSPEEAAGAEPESALVNSGGVAEYAAESASPEEAARAEPEGAAMNSGGVPEQDAEPASPEEAARAEPEGAAMNSGGVAEHAVEPASPAEVAGAEPESALVNSGGVAEQGAEPASPEEAAGAEPEGALVSSGGVAEHATELASPEEAAGAEPEGALVNSGGVPEQATEPVSPEEAARAEPAAQTEKKPFFNTPHIIEGKFFAYPGSSVVRQVDAIYSSFFLVYSNRIYQAHPTLDIFYNRQEPNGAIRNAYSIETGLPVFTPNNPEGIGIPLFAWAEFNLYHKSANKKRVKDVLPVLHRYIDWIDATFKRPNGLYEVPLSATNMENTPREQAVYPMDFNTMMAINVLYMSALSDILNDKDASFHYKKAYFSLKTRINSLMWNADDGFYYDIGRDEKQIPVKTIAGYWPLLAEIPNDDKAEQLIAKLQDPQFFGTPHPFPTLAVNEPCFEEHGCGYRGSVYPHLSFMVIKGLERYQRWDMARECAIRHLYFVLDSMTEGHTNGHHSPHRGNLWEAYLPLREGHAIWPDNPKFPRVQYLTYDALSTICLMIENIVGLFISLPRKTVDWIIPNLEIMGVENLSLKKNMITILSNKSGRGWEIHMESEKLYYFTINILGKKKKTLPIPSGKCSMLIDKL
jgi:neutral trehalase